VIGDDRTHLRAADLGIEEDRAKVNEGIDRFPRFQEPSLVGKGGDLSPSRGG
jgi:hypothetical protein